MRPLDRTAASPVLGIYTKPQTLRLASAGPAATRVFGTDQPLVDDCLELWDRAARGLVLTTDEAAALEAIKAQVDTTYRKAAMPLLDAFGRLCAYCDTPVSELVQVEHLLPKSQYPTFALDMENFLLACGPCNRLKSDSPSRQMAAAWTANPSDPTPADLEAAIRGGHYCWPDTRPTPTWLPLVLEFRDTSGWQAIAPVAASTDPGVAMSSQYHERPVRADIAPLGRYDVEVRVRYEPDPTALPPRGQETVDQCGLNRVGSGTNDDRVGNRTRTWLKAIELWHLEVPDPSNPPAQLSAMFLGAAGATGCFSVWFTVGELIGPGLGVRFASEAADWFPNTDINRLP